MKNSTFFLLLLFVGMLSFFAWKRTDGFTLNKILSSKVEYESGLETLLPSQEVMQIMKKSFTYLGKGRQCFVFESEDRQYVLKFFNYNRERIPSFVTRLLHNFPMKIFTNCRQKMIKKKKRLSSSFASYKLAFDAMPNETGLLYIHLNPSKDLHVKLSLKNCGYFFSVDADTTRFVLQKKAVPLKQAFEQFNKNKTLEKAIDSLLYVIFVRCQKQIVDSDIDAVINFGFIENRAIVFDSGRWFYNDLLKDSKNASQEMIKSTGHLRKFLKKYYSQMLPYFEASLEKNLQILGEEKARGIF